MTHRIFAEVKNRGRKHRISLADRDAFDQMIKIWNNTTKPYKLSIVCKLEGILIDSKRTRRVARVGDVAIALDEKAGIREGGNL